ncbi:MAG TPA: hypothetical protein VH851_11880 [Candidatus Binatia bacterium]
MSADDGHFSYDYYLAKHGAGVLVMPERKGLEFILAQLVSTTPKAKGQMPESLRLLNSGFIDNLKR